DQTNKQLASIIRHAVEFSKNDQTLTSVQQAPHISKNCVLLWLMSTRLLGGKSKILMISTLAHLAPSDVVSLADRLTGTKSDRPVFRGHLRRAFALRFAAPLG
ncbi:hypothetical protein, partial [Flexivirga endophytica]